LLFPFAGILRRTGGVDFSRPALFQWNQGDRGLCRTPRRFPVDNSRNSIDLWRIPNLLLWVAFFAVGLYPEWVYDALRDYGQVASQRALTNSSWLITLSWAAYLAWFSLARCREAGDSPASATAKSVQVFLLGLTAFMPLRLEQVAEYQYIPIPEYRWILYGMIGAKCISCLYLVLIVLRYCLFSGYAVFVNMPALFPSAHAPETGGKRENPEAPRPGQQTSVPPTEDADPSTKASSETR